MTDLGTLSESEKTLAIVPFVSDLLGVILIGALVLAIVIIDWIRDR